MTNLQVDFDNLNARLEEESETSASLRAQLQRAQTDYQQLKSKYDKDLAIRLEEIEEVRSAISLFLFEIECILVHASHLFGVILRPDNEIWR